MQSTFLFFLASTTNSTAETRMLSVTEPLCNIDSFSLLRGYQVLLYRSRIQTEPRINATVVYRK